MKDEKPKERDTVTEITMGADRKMCFTSDRIPTQSGKGATATAVPEESN